MPEAFVPTPGQYLKLRRRTAGLSIEDVALRTDTTPVAVSVRSRAEWIAAIEADAAELKPETALVLNRVYDFDLLVLDELASYRAGATSIAPAICRNCGCSYLDPCSTPHGECHWLENDDSRCSGCFKPDGTPRAAGPDDAEEGPPANDATPAGLTLTYAGFSPTQATAA